MPAKIPTVQKFGLIAHTYKHTHSDVSILQKLWNQFYWESLIHDVPPLYRKKNLLPVTQAGDKANILHILSIKFFWYVRFMWLI